MDENSVFGTKETNRKISKKTTSLPAKTIKKKLDSWILFLHKTPNDKKL